MPSLFIRLGVTPAISFCFLRQQEVTRSQTFQFGPNRPALLVLRFRVKLLRYLLVFFDGVHLLPLHIAFFGKS